MPNKRFLNILLLEFLGMSLASLTGIFGAIPLLILRRRITRTQFILFNAVISISLCVFNPSLIWLPFTVCALVCLIYFELKSQNLFFAAVVSVVATSVLSAALVFIWSHFHTLNIANEIREGITSQLKLFAPQAQFDTEKLFQQVPSFCISAVAVSLWLAILFERRFNRSADMAGGPLEVNIFAFKVPDFTIWIAITSTLFTFVDLHISGLQEVAQNILNVLMLLYFFQGLAIAAYAFYVFQIGSLLKAIFYAIFVTQLFLLVAILGIIDYWLNIREKISKKLKEKV